MLQIGQIVKATVKAVLDYGIELDYAGDRIVVLINEISWLTYIFPRDFAAIGDQMEVQIIRIDSAHPHLASGSIKALHPEKDPWRDPSIYVLGAVHDGVVLAKNEGFYRIRLPTGAEGSLPVTRVNQSWSANDRVRVRIVARHDAARTLDLEAVEGDHGARLDRPPA